MTLARGAPLALFFVSAGIVGSALLMQYVGGLAPCELCLWERWPYYAVAVLALAAVALGRPLTSRIALLLAAAVFLGSAGLAFYHVGVEQHWFEGPTACTESGGPPKTLEEYKRRLEGAQVVACDQPQWTLFGVSLAGDNLLASVVLALGCLLVLRPLAARRLA